jgi:hypothetical protein
MRFFNEDIARQELREKHSRNQVRLVLSDMKSSRTEKHAQKVIRYMSVAHEKFKRTENHGRKHSDTCHRARTPVRLMHKERQQS